MTAYAKLSALLPHNTSLVRNAQVSKENRVEKKNEATAFSTAPEITGFEHAEHALYEPLNSPDKIRIVRINPGSREERLACTISHVKLGSETYEALSYEWGLASDDDPFILIDGRNTRIRTNLRNALVEIRYKDRPRYVWIDALSINQADIQERNHQVRMMREIYQGAQHVIIWLGPEEDQSSMAIDYLATLGRRETAYKKKLIRKMAYKCAALSALSALSMRSYWRRVWVQQEIYLARRFTVCCGNRSIGDYDFITAITWLGGETDMHWRNVNQSPCYPIMKTLVDKILHGTQTYLGRWLDMSRAQQLQASEARDLIYALLAISADCQKSEIIADYDKPVDEVYLETIKAIEAHGTTYRDRQDEDAFKRDLAYRLGLDYDNDLRQRLEPWRNFISSRWMRP
ncbi:heterokaryon incompatibility protein-domain-containing protein [Paraphoma chrysanthemicola]|nr:heterokaryon incompatibility protein-domain-containing protein [Paraphoma chrysanthemicola]